MSATLAALLARAQAAGVARLDAQRLAAHDLGRTREWVAATRFEVEVAGERVPADASLSPWYDPASSRVKG